MRRVTVLFVVYVSLTGSSLGAILADHCGSDAPLAGDPGWGSILSKGSGFNAGPAANSWRMTCDAGSRLAYSLYPEGRDGSLSVLQDRTGWTMTATMKVNSASTDAQGYGFDSCMNVQDASSRWFLHVLDSGLYYANSGAVATAIPVPGLDTSVFNTYQMVYNPAAAGQVDVFVNGSLVFTQISAMVLPNHLNGEKGSVYIGDNDSVSGNVTDVEYSFMRFETGQVIYSKDDTCAGDIPSAGLSLQLIESRQIWDQAPHNAFTDLIRFQGKWYCALREASGHSSYDGILRIIRSDDGVEWESTAGLAFQKPAGYDYADMREGNLSITPSGELLVNSAVALINDGSRIYQSLSYLSPDGTTWSEPYELTDPALNEWMWRTTWHDGYAYNFSYRCSPPYAIQLYRGTDGRVYAPFGPKYFEGNTYPNEHAFVFTEDDTCWCLLRRDGGSRTAQLGRAEPPYDNFQWQDLGVAVGGPEMIQMPNGRLIAAVRLYDGSTRTSICWVDHVNGSMTEMLTLPSGGDTGYAGMVLHDDILWVSYYSSHEGKTCIYLARVRIVYCDTFNPMDFDMDCEVGFSDFAAFVAEWLECTRTDDPSCEQF